MLQFLTDFADQAVVLPAAACWLGWAWGGGWHRGVRAFALALAGVFGLVVLGKLLLGGCGPEGGVWDMLRSPSGHTASAALVFGGGVGVALGWRPCVVVAWAAVVALLVAATRVGLGVHSLADVVAGGVLGVAGAAWLVRAAGPPPGEIWRFWAPALVCALALHGAHLRVEGLLALLRHGRGC